MFKSSNFFIESEIDVIGGVVVIIGLSAVVQFSTENTYYSAVVSDEKGRRDCYVESIDGGVEVRFTPRFNEFYIEFPGEIPIHYDLVDLITEEAVKVSETGSEEGRKRSSRNAIVSYWLETGGLM